MPPARDPKHSIPPTPHPSSLLPPSQGTSGTIGDGGPAGPLGRGDQRYDLENQQSHVEHVRSLPKHPGRIQAAPEII